MRFRRIVNFVMIVCSFSSGDISREVREECLIHIKVSRIFLFAPHTFSSPEHRTMFTENIRGGAGWPGRQGADAV